MRGLRVIFICAVLVKCALCFSTLPGTLPLLATEPAAAISVDTCNVLRGSGQTFWNMSSPRNGILSTKAMLKVNNHGKRNPVRKSARWLWAATVGSMVRKAEAWCEDVPLEERYLKVDQDCPREKRRQDCLIQLSTSSAVESVEYEQLLHGSSASNSW
eukprot:946765-Rhodomonas_salina.2